MHFVLPVYPPKFALQKVIFFGFRVDLKFLGILILIDRNPVFLSLGMKKK